MTEEEIIEEVLKKHESVIGNIMERKHSWIYIVAFAFDCIEIAIEEKDKEIEILRDEIKRLHDIVEDKEITRHVD